MSLLTDLIFYCKLDEASGNAIDAHGSNTLTENGSVGSSTGKIGNARNFTPGNWLSHASNSDLVVGDIDFTHSAWVKFASGSAQALYTKWDLGGNKEYALLANFGANLLQLTVYDVASGGGGSGVTVDFTAITLSTAVWYHVLTWHDSVNNQIGITVNNSAPAYTSHSGGVYSGTSPFRIGRLDGLFSWDGDIDEVGFWKRMLTSQERTDLYNSGAGLPYASFGGGGGGAVIPIFVHHYRMQGAA